MDYFVTNSSLAPAPSGIQSTAGAVPVKNDKGKYFPFSFEVKWNMNEFFFTIFFVLFIDFFVLL